MLGAYFSMSFSQVVKPRFFRFFVVTSLKLSDLPEIKTILNPRLCTFLYRSRIPGTAGDMPFCSHFANFVELYGVPLK